MQLRVAVSDIEKDLPDNDDYFYLRWLRGGFYSSREVPVSIVSQFYCST